MKLELTKLPYLKDTEFLLEKLRIKGGAVALESSLPKHENGRWSIISAEPVEEIHQPENLNTPALRHSIESLFNKIPKQVSDLPFIGGIIGHASYELGRSKLQSNKKTEPSNNVGLIAGLYTWAFIIDHRDLETTLIYWTGISISSTSDLVKDFLESITQITPSQPLEITTPFKAHWNKSIYSKKIHQIHDYINAGDVYQVNLAQTFSANYLGSPVQAYKKLKDHGRTPFSVFFETNNFSFASASPELFISVSNDKITSKPIKGTLPRHPDKEKDLELKNQLRASKKDQAENLMIVDLLRNDISKNAYRVSVPKIFKVESFETVHHLVSTIEGHLNKDTTPIKLFLDAFPGGSITGAPKKRAMEIIEELEDNPRSFYCGSSFYYSANGNFNSNILIRSFLFEGDRVTCWAGGGIISDSKWELEFQESLDKISKLMQSLG